MVRYLGMKRLLLVLLGLVALLPASCGGGGPQDGTRIVGGSDRVVAEGDSAPAFRLPSASGRDVSLDEFLSKQAVLLYFSMGPG
jgi:hypothetical protein